LGCFGVVFPIRLVIPVQYPKSRGRHVLCRDADDHAFVAFVTGPAMPANWKPLSR
jgi:hypothetical protein